MIHETSVMLTPYFNIICPKTSFPHSLMQFYRESCSGALWLLCADECDVKVVENCARSPMFLSLLLHPSFCQGGEAGICWGSSQGVGIGLSVHDVCDVWNFCYNGRNWQLTTLWDLIVVLKFYVFKAILD